MEPEYSRTLTNSVIATMFQKAFGIHAYRQIATASTVYCVGDHILDTISDAWMANAPQSSIRMRVGQILETAVAMQTLTKELSSVA